MQEGFAINSAGGEFLAWIFFNLNVAGNAVAARVGEMVGPVFVLCVIAILVLERYFPARPNQKLFSANVAQDAVWFLFQAAGEATLLAAWALLLKRFYEAYLGFLTIETMARLPGWAHIVISLIVLDFLRWLQHVLHHKVPWFWSLHAVHHSQRQLNLFSDFRYHILEYVVRQAVFFLPMMVFGLAMPEIVLVTLILIWHARLTHANVRTNFGWLRCVLVTPQSHRIHHSIEKHHRDRNYGAFLCVWDRLFGTQHPDEQSYPDTGITDERFPCEHSISPAQLLIKPVEQLLYPIYVIAGSLFTGLRRRREG